MPDKEKDWNYWFTIFIIFLTIYTVIKDAIEINIFKTTIEFIGAGVATVIVIKRINRQIK